MALGIEFGVRLRDGVLLLLHRRQIDDVVGDLVVDDLAVRRIDETVFVDAAERGEAVDQPDVRAFGRLDRADAAIMRSEEHTSELQSLMRISYAVFCLKKKKYDKMSTAI